MSLSAGVPTEPFVTSLSNDRHPRFTGGLLLRDQLERYGGALKQRTATSSDEGIAKYVATMESHLEEYNRHFRDTSCLEPVPDKLVDELASNPYTDDNFGNKSAIIIACDLREPDVLEKVCTLHAKVPGLLDVVDEFGDRSIDHACIMLAERELDILLEHGASVALESAFGGNCLHWLACASHAIQDEARDPSAFAYMWTRLTSLHPSLLSKSDSFGKTPSDYL
jgi:hypothetical protein